jgi:hypothetical protein
MGWATVVAFCAAASLAMNMADPDLWHRLAVGEWLWRERTWPSPDPFSWTSSRAASVDHEWGSGVLFTLAWHFAGAPGLVAIKVGCYLAAVTGVVRAASLRPRGLGGGDTLLALVVAVALAPGFSTTLRCQAFTYAFLAWWLAWLVAARGGGRMPWARLLLSMWAWSQLHGGFVSGVGLAVAFAAGEWLNGRSPWRFAALAAFAGAITLLNPFGYLNHLAVWRAITHPREFVPEWAPVTAHSLLQFPGYTAMLALAVAAAALGIARWRRGRRPDAVGVLLVGGAVVMSLRHLRHVVLLGILAPPWVMPPMRAWLRLAMRGARARRFVAVICGTLAGSAMIGWAVLGDGAWISIPEGAYPLRAVCHLHEHGPKGKLLVPFNWGSYALYHLRDTHRVSFDGRYDLIYDDATIELLTAWEFGSPGSERLLSEHPPDVALVMRGSWPHRALAASPRWRLIYEDDSALVFAPLREATSE